MKGDGFCCRFGTGFYSIALAGLKLAMQARLASSSKLHLPLPPKC